MTLKDGYLPAAYRNHHSRHEYHYFVHNFSRQSSISIESGTRTLLHDRRGNLKSCRYGWSKVMTRELKIYTNGLNKYVTGCYESSNG